MIKLVDLSLCSLPLWQALQNNFTDIFTPKNRIGTHDTQHLYFASGKITEPNEMT